MINDITNSTNGSTINGVPPLDVASSCTAKCTSAIMITLVVAIVIIGILVTSTVVYLLVEKGKIW